MRHFNLLNNFRWFATVTLIITFGVGSTWGTIAPATTVLWSENFDHFGTNTPSAAGTNTGDGGGTVIWGSASITYTQSTTDNKGYNETYAGGTAPELMIKKGSTSWTISGIKTGGATEMSLTFNSNYASYLSVTTSESTKLAVSGTDDTRTISVKAGQTSPETFNITITNTQGTGNKAKNVRIDDVVLTVTTAGVDPSSCTSDATVTASGNSSFF